MVDIVGSKMVLSCGCSIVPLYELFQSRRFLAEGGWLAYVVWQPRGDARVLIVPELHVSALEGLPASVRSSLGDVMHAVGGMMRRIVFPDGELKTTAADGFSEGGAPHRHVVIERCPPEAGDAPPSLRQRRLLSVTGTPIQRLRRRLDGGATLDKAGVLDLLSERAEALSRDLLRQTRTGYLSAPRLRAV